jgi:hypothetical protein
MKFTIKQLAEKLNVDTATAGQLVKLFVREGGALALEPAEKVKGQKGKPATVYALNYDLPERMAKMFMPLVAPGQS